MPPSRDPNFRAKGRSKSTRSPGGQSGHKGVTLQPVDEPDKVIPIEMKPEDVPPGYRKVGYEARQVFDIILKRHVIEYQADVYEDDKGHRLVAPFPADVARKVQYGNTTKAHIVYLNVGQMLPYNRIQDYFGENDLPLSEGSTYNFMQMPMLGLKTLSAGLSGTYTGQSTSTVMRQASAWAKRGGGCTVCIHLLDKPLYAPSQKRYGSHERHGDPAPFLWRSHP